jgi:acyl-[acyl-carrier-protein]-phospholipid O-acyltransferase/long-chain-fatty-acid--[acyl-carrier-protein] ligase
MTGNYRRLLSNLGFESFLWTQFLGAFNDNVYKMMVSILAVEIASNRQLGARYLSVSLAVFVLPYLLFAGYAGQLADRFSKTRVLQVTKSLEIVTMVLGLFALLSNRIELLVVVLFLLATQANFFSPAKYGILPEITTEAEITAANGMVEFTTLAAIVLGTSFGGMLIHIWKNNPWNLGGTLLVIAVVGTLCSFKIPFVASAGSRERFHPDPFREVWFGFRCLQQNRALALTILGLSYFWFIGALFQAAILLVGSEVLHAKDFEISLLAGMLALGIAAGAIAAGWLSRTHIELGLVPVGTVLLGVFSVLLGIARSYEWISVLLVAAGFAGGLFFVPLNAYLQERAGNQEKGRMLATNNFFNTVGMLIASGLLSLLHDSLHLSASMILSIIGIVTLGATVYALLILPGDVLRLALFSLSRFYFKVRVCGAEHIPATGGAILISNHVSYADAALIGGCTHRFVHFLMWKPIYDLPFAKPFFRILKAVPIDGASPKESLRALRKAADEIRCGELVCIFPEGALTRTGHVQTFQRGIERLMADVPDAPVIPIYLDGLWRHPLSAMGTRGFMAWLKAFRHEITIVIGEPITTRQFAFDLRNSILELGCDVVAFRKKSDATLAHALVRSARRKWSKPAIADSTNKELSYGQTLMGSLLIRDWLNKQHAGETHVGLLLPSSVGGALANFGSTLADRTVVNLNFTAGEANCRSAVEQCGIRTVLTSRIFVQKAKLFTWPEMVYLEDLLSSFGRAQKLRAFLLARFASTRKLAGHKGPDDVATVLFSSGSTGVPKGIELTHWNVLTNIAMAGSLFPHEGDHCMLGVLPFFHSFGYTFALWFPVVESFRAAFHASPTDAKIIGDLVQKHRATYFLSTPTFCVQYVRKCTPEQFATLRYVLVGAEKLRDATAKEFKDKFGMDLLAGYGATELGPCATANLPESSNLNGQPGSRSGTVGRPLPNVVMRVVDPETLQPLRPGEQGMLLVKSPSRMKGYLGTSEKTARVLRDGFYITGDLASLDEDGFVHIKDRLARFSKIGGEMVPHLKIEEACSTVLGDGFCFVTGIDDPRRGERLILLHTSKDVNAADIVGHLQDAGLPALWIPKRDQIHFVESIPTLGTGKVDLAKARAMAVEKSGQAMLV